MKISFSTAFQKQFGKLDKKIQDAFKERLILFKEEKFHFLLKNHRLNGFYKDKRNINITSDYRAIFEEIEETTEFHILFIAIETHSQLYK
jgi:addiction module RelE/StbE family toxin